jgi:Arylsulfotransferase (ASST)
LDFLYRRSVPAWIVAVIILGFLGAMVTVAHLVQRKVNKWPTPFYLDEAAWALASVPHVFLGLSRNEDAASYAVTDKLPSGLHIPPGEAFRDPGHVLVTHFDDEEDRRTIRLLRLSDGAFVKRFPLKRRVSSVQPEELISPFLMPDGGLVYQDNAGLTRVDACGTPLWEVKRRTHHSIERAENGDMWVPTWIKTPSKRSPDEGVDSILRVSADGKPIYEKRLDTMFVENGMMWILQGRTYNPDPFHLNDIEPVLSDGVVWKKGDVFLSMRNISMLALFRPSTGKIIWWQTGPWINQHDVQILDENRIALFDNRAAFVEAGGGVLGNSHEMIMDFRDKSVTSPYDAAFRKHKVVAPVQGRGLILDNDDIFVEETTFGRLLRMDKDGNIKWRYIAANPDGERYPLGWTRYLDPAEFGQAITAASQAKCPAQ